jgi:hypothetical protein
MKKLCLVLWILFCAIPVFAQEAREHVLQVVVDSAFIRAAPDSESDAVASVFANDSLVAVGRNIDGEWLEVRRPGRTTGGGWIARRLTVFTFEVSQLPLTDLITGIIGQEPVIDTGFSVLTISEGVLRTNPDRHAAQIDLIPVNLTLPVIERTPDNQWLKINFRGAVGWLAEFETRTSADLNAIPISPEYAGNAQYAAFEIIPLEVQIAQIDGLLTYLIPLSDVTANVVNYWSMMSEGETLECLPPEGGYGYYPATPRDVTELPELRQQRRLLTRAVDDINAAIQAMKRCGVYTQSEIREAYAHAINAQAIFKLVTTRMDNLYEKLAG